MVSLDPTSYDTVEQYVRLFSYAPRARMQYVLQEWEENKDMWYEVLGRNLDVKIADVCCENVSDEFCTAWEATQLAKFCDEVNARVSMTNIYSVFSASAGFKNIVEEDFYARCRTPEGGRLVVRAHTAGLRLFKALKLVINELRDTTSTQFSLVREYVNSLSEKYIDDMRNEVSRLLQAQKIDGGELHLSIHPIDFMTASDNLHNWTSCMSWVNSGCYRTGTIEMMNSKYVACAYVCKKGDVMHIGSDYSTCSNKIWRAWVYLLDDGNVRIVGVNYPYYNAEWTGMVLDWLREHVPVNHRLLRTPLSAWGGRDDVEIVMNFMYNDFDDSSKREDIMCDINPSLEDKHVYFDVSGIVRCFECGRARDPELDVDVCEEHGGYEDTPNYSFICGYCIDNYDKPLVKPETYVNGVIFTAQNIHGMRSQDLEFNIFDNTYHLNTPYYDSSYSSNNYAIIVVNKGRWDDFLRHVELVKQKNGLSVINLDTDPVAFSPNICNVIFTNMDKYYNSVKLFRALYPAPYLAEGVACCFIGMEEDFYQDSRKARIEAFDAIKRESKNICLY